MLAAAEAGGGELPRGFTLPMVPPERLEPRPSWHRLRVTAGEADGAIDLGWLPAEPFVGRPRALADAVALADSATVVMATEQDERLAALLDESKVKVRPADVDLDLDVELKPAFFRADVDITAGCTQPAIGFRISTDAELFGRLRRPGGRGHRQAATRAQDLTREFTLDFVPEELVVHVDHGIARFKGMRLIETDGAHREYLELEYAEGDRLFVPSDQVGMVAKYLGGDAPRLHRMGGSDWARATAKVSMRMVPNQNPEKIIAAYKKFVANNTPAGIQTEVRVLSWGPAIMVNPDHPAIHVAASAFRDILGKETVFIRSGGSIPIVGDFAKHLGIPTILMGFGLPDDGLHSPNEKYKVANYYAGIMTIAHFFEQYGQ